MKKLVPLVALLFLLLTGCMTTISTTGAYAKGSKPDPGMGYLVGTLSVYNKEIWAAGFAVEFVNQDNPKDNIVMVYADFKRTPSEKMGQEDKEPLLKESVVIVPAKPGRYKLSNVIYLNFRSAFEGKDPITLPAYSQEFAVRPGSIYYVGDWACFYQYYSEGGKRNYVWKMAGIFNRLEDTKQILAADYTEFKDWGVETIIR